VSVTGSYCIRAVFRVSLMGLPVRVRGPTTFDGRTRNEPGRLGRIVGCALSADEGDRAEGDGRGRAAPAVARKNRSIHCIVS